MNQRPIALGLMVCEQVVIEEKTRNATIVNCFSRRIVSRFPSEALSFVVFAFLTDGAGEIRLEVTVERLDTLEEIYRVSFLSRFPHPLQVMRCIARIRGCLFPVPGHYQVSLLGDGEVLAQRKVILVEEENVS